MRGMPVIVEILFSESVSESTWIRTALAKFHVQPARAFWPSANRPLLPQPQQLQLLFLGLSF